jgi:hypothetical protein
MCSSIWTCVYRWIYVLPFYYIISAAASMVKQRWMLPCDAGAYLCLTLLIILGPPYSASTIWWCETHEVNRQQSTEREHQCYIVVMIVIGITKLEEPDMSKLKFKLELRWHVCPYICIVDENVICHVHTHIYRTYRCIQRGWPRVKTSLSKRGCTITIEPVVS